MKPDWDKLMDEFKDSTTSLVADVDCTADGKDLCSTHGIRGYPTIKYGDPADLKDYDGGRDFAAFKKFAEENLGPTCGVENIDLCSDEDKSLIEKFLSMDESDLDKVIAEVDAKTQKIADKGNMVVGALRVKINEYQKEIAAETKKKDDEVAKETKKTGLKMMRAVVSQKKKEDDSSSKKKKKKKGKKN